MIRLLLADDHLIFRQGLLRLLADQKDMVVVAEAGTCAEVLEALRLQDVHVAVLDLSMPGRDGAEMIRQSKAVRPAIKTLVITMHKGEAYVVSSLRAGADGYVLKDDSAETLVSAIRHVANGGRFLSPEIAELIAGAIPYSGKGEPPHTRLSEREYKVFQMLIAGMRGSEIARELSLSEKTVSTHKAHVLRKMNLNNRTDLIVYAIKHQMIEA